MAMAMAMAMAMDLFEGTGSENKLLQSATRWIFPAANLLLAISFIYACFLRYHLRFGSKHRPSCSFHQWLGNLLGLVRNRHRIHDYFTQKIQTSASLTYQSSRPGMTTLVTANPENIEHILRTNFENYPKGLFILTTLNDFLGSGIFNVDGEYWKFQRKVASQEFTTRSLRDFMVESFKKEAGSRLLPTLEQFSHSGETFDMQNLLTRFTFDTICNISFGIDPACLHFSLPTVEFMEAFEDATRIIAGRFASVHPLVWKIKRALDIGSERRLRKAVLVLDNFATNVIRLRKREIEAKGKKNGGDDEKRADLLSRFIFNMEQSEYGQDFVDIKKHSEPDKFLRDVMISFLIAGIDTSSVALSWFFWLLSRHPLVQRNCYDEIERVVEKRSIAVSPAVKTSAEEKSQGNEEPQTCTADEHNGKYTLLSYSELKQLNYLQAAVSESLRLHPPVPVNARISINDDVLPDGTFIQKNTTVFYHPYAAARMESIWGKDCLEFKPERWLKDGKFVAENPYKYPVFHAGPRICLGKDMGIIQVKYVAASIIYNDFNIKLANPNYKPRSEISLTLKMVDGLPVKASKRRS